MNVIAKKRLREFWQRHPRSKAALEDWYTVMTKAEFTSPDDVRRAYGKGLDFIADNRAIFDIRNNEFRLIVHFSYTFKVVNVKFVGTHKDYDNINPVTVS